MHVTMADALGWRQAYFKEKGVGCHRSPPPSDAHTCARPRAAHRSCGGRCHERSPMLLLGQRRPERKRQQPGLCLPCRALCLSGLKPMKWGLQRGPHCALGRLLVPLRIARLIAVYCTHALCTVCMVCVCVYTPNYAASKVCTGCRRLSHTAGGTCPQAGTCAPAAVAAPRGARACGCAGLCPCHVAGAPVRRVPCQPAWAERHRRPSREARPPPPPAAAAPRRRPRGQKRRRRPGRPTR